MIKREDGQALVEFALMIPLLLLLLTSVFDFGRILYTKLNLELVNQESVRIGGLGQGDEAIRSYAFSKFTAGDPSKLEISISPVEAERESGDYLTVTLAYPESFVGILGKNAIPYTVKTSSTIRVE
jgi:Flp pilus assembly protein TadG